MKLLVKSNVSRNVELAGRRGVEYVALLVLNQSSKDAPYATFGLLTSTVIPCSPFTSSDRAPKHMEMTDTWLYALEEFIGGAHMVPKK
jgi:hypothetical protein